MRRIALLAALIAAGATLVGGSAQAQHATSWCAGAQLTGRFAGVPGSAGAGNIVYALTLTNRSTRSCTVSGLPKVTLLGIHGRRLATQVVAARPNQLTAALITLTHGGSARATARFSPDVPGVGEGQIGPCEPKAYRLSVTSPGGGAAVVPISPPTSVCEHGRLQFSAYSRSS